MLKERLLKALPSHASSLKVLDDSILYVADWKDYNNGGVTFTGDKPFIEALVIVNGQSLPVCCDAFEENALPIKKGLQSKQCECVLFPDCADTQEWVLFVEMKYAKSEAGATNPLSNYAGSLVRQIADTAKYFRGKDIIGKDKIVFAIASFSNLDIFGSWLNASLIDAALTEGIILKATNHAHIVSDRLIELG